MSLKGAVRLETGSVRVAGFIKTDMRMLCNSARNVAVIVPTGAKEEEFMSAYVWKTAKRLDVKGNKSHTQSLYVLCISLLPSLFVYISLSFHVSLSLCC